MAKHTRRDLVSGRFTASRAPIDPDNSAYVHVVAPSADPQGEHDKGGYPSFSKPYPAHGPEQRLNNRRQIVVDAQSGEELDARISRVAVPDLRTRAMLASANSTGTVHDEFISELVAPMTGSPVEGHRRLPGSGGYRLPSVYDRPFTYRDEDGEPR